MTTVQKFTTFDQNGKPVQDGEVYVSDEKPGACGVVEEKKGRSYDVEDKSREDESKPPGVYSSAPEHIKRFLLRKTTFLVYCHICLGLFGGLIGPTQLDMRDQLEGNITMEHMGISLSFRSLGGMTASILVGFLIDRIYQYTELILAIGMGAAAIIMFIKPWVRYFWALCILMFIEGMGSSTENCCVNAILIRLWGPDGDSPMQIMHMGYGIGNFLAPILAAPFLGPSEEDDEDSHVNTSYYNDYTTTAWSPNATQVPEEIKEARLEVPYTIVGIFVAISALGALYYQYKDDPKELKTFSKPKDTTKKVFSLSACGVDSKVYAVTIVSMVFTFYFVVQARDLAINGFLSPYAVESDLAFSKQEAAILDAMVRLALPVGRLIAGLILPCVPIQAILFTVVFGGSLSTLGLSTIGTQEAWGLWLFATLAMLFSAPIWPGGYTWTDKYVILAGMILGGVDIVTGLSGTIFNWFVGWLYTYYSPESIMYFSFVCSVILCVVLVVMQITASSHGYREFVDIPDMEVYVDGEKEDIAGDYDEDSGYKGKVNMAAISGSTIELSETQVDQL